MRTFASIRATSRVALVLSLALAGPAQAHVGHELTTSFTSGLGHPASGLDHLLAMVAVGLWAAGALEAGRRWLAPASFVGAMVLAAAATMQAASNLPMLEAAIATSVVLLGALMLAGRRVPAGAALTLVAAAGALHGAAHGLELPPDGSGLPYALGFVAATSLLHAVGLGVGAILRRGADGGARQLPKLLGLAVGFGGMALVMARV